MSDRVPPAGLSRWAFVLLASVALAVPSRGALLGAAAPNELGEFMILEYHKIDFPEARWTRTPEHFRGDLESLWSRGYRLMALDDLLDGRVAAPAGTTPIVLTFDDSSPGQFRYLDHNGTLIIDPTCAVGVLEAFAREHPEFGHAATFYVLPGASPPNRLFNQPALAGRKLQYLATHGYEIGNHTLWHATLSKYPESVVRAQIAEAQQWIDRDVPGYRLRTLALPMGAYPRDLDWAIAGDADGTSYQNDAILMIAGGPAPSPYARTFDPYHLPRIQATAQELANWLTYFDRHPERRYVSDGDPTTITIPRGTRSAVQPRYATRVVERP